jgi:hypothetical protein
MTTVSIQTSDTVIYYHIEYYVLYYTFFATGHAVGLFIPVAT